MKLKAVLGQRGFFVLLLFRMVNIPSSLAGITSAFKLSPINTERSPEDCKLSLTYIHFPLMF